MRAFNCGGLMLALTLMTVPASAQSGTNERTVRIIAGGSELKATLNDTAASRDLMTLLPLHLQMTDYNGAEKIAKLPKGLSAAGAPDGADPNVGDIAYYAPWGNFVVYYGDVQYWPGIVPLGHVEGSLNPFAGQGAVDVRIERLEPSK